MCLTWLSHHRLLIRHLKLSRRVNNLFRCTVAYLFIPYSFYLPSLPKRLQYFIFNLCFSNKTNRESGGIYPYWFLHYNHFQKLNNGVYTTLSPGFFSTPLQTIFVFNNYDEKAMLYVNTPQLDRPGLYAVFESTRYSRDEAFYMTAEDTFYVCHRAWPGENTIIHMRTNILSIPGRARL